MKDRIKLLMESQHMAQHSFAQFIGLSPATLSSIFNGRTNPTLATVEAIHSKLPLLNIDWLMFGNGPMYKNTQYNTNNTSDSETTNDSQPALLFDDSEDNRHESGSVPQQQSFSAKQTRKTSNSDENLFDKKPKTITEIRVFFDDQTYESFVPKK